MTLGDLVSCLWNHRTKCLSHDQNPYEYHSVGYDRKAVLVCEAFWEVLLA